MSNPKKGSDPKEQEKIFDFALHRKDGRVLLSWRFDRQRAEEAAKETIQSKGSDLIGSLFDKIKKKLTGSQDPEEE